MVKTTFKNDMQRHIDGLTAISENSNLLSMSDVADELNLELHRIMLTYTRVILGLALARADLPMAAKFQRQEQAITKLVRIMEEINKND